MKLIALFIAAFALLPLSAATAQEPAPRPNPENKQQLSLPGSAFQYNIASYKNIDMRKAAQLIESAGLHPDIYISNTRQGVIIIHSENTGPASDVGHILSLNPTWYASHSLQDTVVAKIKGSPAAGFDFTKASSILHDYRNAFNYKTEKRGGISWSKAEYEKYKEDAFVGQLIYDIIVVTRLPK